jgi:hypothetical protein
VQIDLEIDRFYWGSSIHILQERFRRKALALKLKVLDTSPPVVTIKKNTEKESSSSDANDLIG